MKKQVIILMGPPGAGKGTQAEILVDIYGLVHLESSKVIEAQFKQHDAKDSFTVDGETFTYGAIEEQWASGILVEPVVVSYWIAEEIRHHAAKGTSLVFSGSPRTMLEAKVQIPLHRELFGEEQMHIFNIQVPAESSIYRNSHRRICKDCRLPIPFTPETENMKTCPKCGGAIVKRGKLDDVETIKVRLVEYAERTLPIIEFIRAAGLVVHDIDGEGSIEDVAARIAQYTPDVV